MSLGTLTFEIDADASGVDEATSEVEERLQAVEEQLQATSEASEEANEKLAAIGSKMNIGMAIKGVKMAAAAVKELGAFVLESARNAADAGSGPMKKFVANIEAIEDAFARVGAQAAQQLAPILDMLTKEFLNSKDAANALKDAGNFIAGVFRVLGSVGAVVIGVFDAVGKSIGAVASAIVSVFSGDFASAADAMKTNFLDVEKIVKRTLGQVEALMTTKGGGDFSGPTSKKGSGNAAAADAEVRRLQKAADDAANSVARLADETEGWDPTSDWESFTKQYQEQLSQAPLVIAEGAFAMMESMQQVSGVMSAFGGAVLQAIPRLNELVSAAMQGAQVGGVWGALIAVFVQLASQTEGFQKILALVDHDLDRLVAGISPLVDAFAQLMEAMGPMSDSITDIIVTVLRPISSILKILAPILKIVGATFQLVGFMLEPVIALFDKLDVELQKFSDWVDDFLSKFKNFFGGSGFKSDKEIGLDTKNAHPGNPNFDLNLDLSWDPNFKPPTKALDAFTTGLIHATTALTNVPQGYKVAQARFEQQQALGELTMIMATGALLQAMLGSFSIPHMAAGGIVTAPTLALIGEAGPEAVVPLDGSSGAGGFTNYGNITVVANDPEEFMRKLRKKNFARKGTGFAGR